jgi:hypothetical protein
MSPELLLKLLKTGLGPDDIMYRFDPDELAASLLGPVGGPAGSPYGLWGALYGSIEVPEFSEAEIWESMLPAIMRM